jgi:hypothetical protein
MTRENRNIERTAMLTEHFYVKSNLYAKDEATKFLRNVVIVLVPPQKPVILRYTAVKNVSSCKEHVKVYKLGNIRVTNIDVRSDICIPDRSQTDGRSI